MSEISQKKALKQKNDELALKDGKYLPFIVSYIATNNLGQASEEAGIARDTGRLWLKKPDVQQLLIRKRNELAIAVDISGQEVLKELKSLAFSNIEDYLDENGQMKPISEMPNTAAIQEMIVVDKVIGDKENQRTERTTKIKLVDKLNALKQVSENLNLFAMNDGKRPVVVNFNNIPTDVLRKLLDKPDTIDITDYQE